MASEPKPTKSLYSDEFAGHSLIVVPGEVLRALVEAGLHVLDMTEPGRIARLGPHGAPWPGPETCKVLARFPGSDTYAPDENGVWASWHTDRLGVALDAVLVVSVGGEALTAAGLAEAARGVPARVAEMQGRRDVHQREGSERPRRPRLLGEGFPKRGEAEQDPALAAKLAKWSAYRALVESSWDNADAGEVVYTDSPEGAAAMASMTGLAPVIQEQVRARRRQTQSRTVKQRRDQRLRLVARTYKVAEGKREVIAAVAERLGVAPATAKNYIGQARKAGLLPPAPPGRKPPKKEAGE